MTPDELGKTFDRYRSYVIHQYELTNHRTTWFVNIQAFLLAAFAFTLQKKLEVVARDIPKLCECGESKFCIGLTSELAHIDAFLLFLCFIGSGISVLAYFLIEAARLPIKSLQDRWEEKIGTSEVKDGGLRKKLEEGNQVLLVGGVQRGPAKWGRLLTLFLPFLLCVGWLVLAYVTGLDQLKISGALAPAIVLACPAVIILSCLIISAYR